MHRSDRVVSVRNRLPDQTALAEGAHAFDLIISLDKLEALLERAAPDDGVIAALARDLLGRIRKDTQQLSKDQMQLATLCEIGREAASILALDDLLKSVLDQGIRLVQAERGLIVLCRDGTGDDFDVSLVRGMDQSAMEWSDERAVSRKLIRHVLRERRPLITTDAQSDSRFDTSASVVALQIRSVLAVPLIFQQGLDWSNLSRHPDERADLRARGLEPAQCDGEPGRCGHPHCSALW